MTALTKGNLLIPTELLKATASRVLDDSELRLLAWESTDAEFLLRFDLSRAVSPVKLHEADVKLETTALCFDHTEQTLRFKPTLIGISGEGVTSKIVLCIAKVLFAAWMQEAFEKEITKTSLTSDLKIEKAADECLQVDFRDLPEVKALAEWKPIPLINKSVLNLVRATGCRHTQHGIEIFIRPTSGFPFA